jgi:hypothetical protein
MTTSTFTTTHVRAQTQKTFSEVTAGIERQLGKLDPTAFQSLGADNARDGSKRWLGAAASCSSARPTTGRS